MYLPLREVQQFNSWIGTIEIPFKENELFNLRLQKNCEKKPILVIFIKSVFTSNYLITNTLVLFK